MLLAIGREPLITSDVIGLCVPVVTIETNGQSPAREIGVGDMPAKFALFLIGDTQQVKHRVATIFEAVNTAVLQRAFQRTMPHVFRTLSPELLPAGGAGLRDFAITPASQRRVMALDRAMNLCALARLECLPAIGASLLWEFVGLSVALERTVIRLIGAVVVRLSFDCLSADRTGANDVGHENTPSVARRCCLGKRRNQRGKNPIVTTRAAFA